MIGLKPGDVWYHKLEFELEACDVMVLVVSEKIRTSKWVHNEVSMAEEIGIPVIPVLAKAIRTPLWLRHLQNLDFCTQQNWQLLLEAVNPHIQSIQKLQASTESNILTNITSDIAIPQWASHSGEDQYGLYADLDVNGVIQRSRLIRAGTFWMGSPQDEVDRLDRETRHQVTLTKGYWLADSACSQALWQQVMGSNPSNFKAKNNPVEQVSWDDIQDFCQALNNQVAGLNACLPTEAEWEYACRAGTQTPFPFGENITPEQVNYNGNYPYAKAEKGLYREKTGELKSLPANPWGLYEMHGNVCEWCQDYYGAYSEDKAIDPTGVSRGTHRVLRGGGWIFHGQHVRSAYRHNLTPDYRRNNIGFRFSLGHELKPSKEQSGSRSGQ